MVSWDGTLWFRRSFRLSFFPRRFHCTWCTHRPYVKEKPFDLSVHNTFTFLVISWIRNSYRCWLLFTSLHSCIFEECITRLSTLFRLVTRPAPGCTLNPYVLTDLMTLVVDMHASYTFLECRCSRVIFHLPIYIVCFWKTDLQKLRNIHAHSRRPTRSQPSWST